MSLQACGVTHQVRRFHLLRSTALPLVFLGGIYLAISPGSEALAADAYWDTAPNNGTIDGGTGNWNGANWTNAADSGAGANWSAGDTAIFGGTAGTVTVSGTEQIAGLIFDTDGYVISGGTLDINGASAILSATGTAVIGSSIADTGGTPGAVQISNGTIVLSGGNTYTGLTTVSSGATLNVTGTTTGSVTVSSGGALNHDGTIDSSVSNSGTTTLAGNVGGTVTQANGSTTVDGDPTVTGAVLVSGGAFTVGAGHNLTSSTSFTASGGTTQNDGTITGAVTLNGGGVNNNGTITGLVSVNSSTLSSTGTIGGGLSVANGASANIAGTLNGGVNNSGTLNFTATTVGSSSITNNATGTITADGTLALNSFTGFASYGTFDLQDGDVGEQVTIAANVHFGPGSFEIDIASNGSSDKLIVNGTIVLGGSLNVNSVDAEAAFQAAASGSGGQIEYIIIENDASDAVTGTFSTVTDDLAFFDSAVSTTGGTGNDVLLTLTSQTVDFMPFATSGNQSGAANALDDFDYSSTEGQGIRVAFQALTNEQAATALTQMTGDGHVGTASGAGATSANFANTVLQNAAQAGGFGAIPASGQGSEPVSAYAAETGDGDRFGAFDAVATAEKSARELATGYALWTQIAGGYHSVDADQNASKLESYSGGVFVGTEFVRIEGAFDAVLGGSAGYSHTVFDNNTSGYDASADSFHAAIYGGIGATGINQSGFGLTGVLSYSHHEYETERDILVGNLTAEADYAGYTYGGQLRARYGHQVSIGSADVVVAPVAGFNLYANETDSFQETGAGLLNLSGEGVSTTNAASVLGASISNAFQFGSVWVTSGITAQWERQFGDTSSAQTMMFTGSPTSFRTVSPEEARDVFALGTSTSMELTDRIQLNLSGRSTLSETSQSAESRLQLKMRL